MNPSELVARIRDEVIEQNMAHYKTMLETPSVAVRDKGVRAIVTAYERMDTEQKAAVQALVRQVLVDTVSNLFGILDGSTLLTGFREQFVLTYGMLKTRLNGDLQDLFLADET